MKTIMCVGTGNRAIIVKGQLEELGMRGFKVSPRQWSDLSGLPTPQDQLIAVAQLVDTDGIYDMSTETEIHGDRIPVQKEVSRYMGERYQRVTNAGEIAMREGYKSQ